MSNKRRGNINGRTTQAFNGGHNSQDCSRSNNSRPSTRVVGNLNSEQYYADACFMTPFQYQHAYMYGIPYAHYSTYNGEEYLIANHIRQLPYPGLYQQPQTHITQRRFPLTRTGSRTPRRQKPKTRGSINRLPEFVLAAILEEFLSYSISMSYEQSCVAFLRLRLVSRGFNKAMLTVICQYISRVLRLRYDISPKFKYDSDDRSVICTGQLIPQFVRLVRSKKNNPYVCISCGYVSLHASSVPTRDRNNCGRMCFACFKPSLYDRMTSSRFIKTVGELVEFRERYMSELTDDVWVRELPWVWELNKDGQYTRWICYQRLKEFVKFFYSGKVKLITEGDNWVIV
ncbi:1753_t:CDS:1 [Paraglomus brasilianum]|uniref:1753_t:CDS:1 n=1 Tax=Paraglomus brasilianum TaxID=144538 RepID=A0A9N9AYT5_9GLOM|nr:1753_t:CDS:1 [Paraglomus brasilianum]